MKKTLITLLVLAVLTAAAIFLPRLFATEDAPQTSSVAPSSAETSSQTPLEEPVSSEKTPSEESVVSEVVTPTVILSSERVYQGGYLTVTTYHLTDPQISTTLDFEPQFFRQDDHYVALVPVSYKTKAGEFALTVTADELTATYPFTVEKYAFDEQHMTIDEEIADSTVNNDNANWELYSAMKEPKALRDDTFYAVGDFVWPTTGNITTEFGMIRYVNGETSSSRHSGIDIAADADTPVVAPNNGRVVLAKYLQMTGNTIVIEHGFGLKSIYYHMNSLSCKEGDMVEKGQEIGKVGSTGFSTGPHLHFSMAVNTVWIDPWLFIDESLRNDR